MGALFRFPQSSSQRRPEDSLRFYWECFNVLLRFLRRKAGKESDTHNKIHPEYSTEEENTHEQGFLRFVAMNEVADT